MKTVFISAHTRTHAQLFKTAPDYIEERKRNEAAQRAAVAEGRQQQHRQMQEATIAEGKTAADVEEVTATPTQARGAAALARGDGPRQSSGGGFAVSRACSSPRESLGAVSRASAVTRDVVSQYSPPPSTAGMTTTVSSGRRTTDGRFSGKAPRTGDPFESGSSLVRPSNRVQRLSSAIGGGDDGVNRGVGESVSSKRRPLVAVPRYDRNAVALGQARSAGIGKSSGTSSSAQGDTANALGVTTSTPAAAVAATAATASSLAITSSSWSSTLTSTAFRPGFEVDALVSGLGESLAPTASSNTTAIVTPSEGRGVSEGSTRSTPPVATGAVIESRIGDSRRVVGTVCPGVIRNQNTSEVADAVGDARKLPPRSSGTNSSSSNSGEACGTESASEDSYAQPVASTAAREDRTSFRRVPLNVEQQCRQGGMVGVNCKDGGGGSSDGGNGNHDVSSTGGSSSRIYYGETGEGGVSIMLACEVHQDGSVDRAMPATDGARRQNASSLGEPSDRRNDESEINEVGCAAGQEKEKEEEQEEEEGRDGGRRVMSGSGAFTLASAANDVITQEREEAEAVDPMYLSDSTKWSVGNEEYS